MAAPFLVSVSEGLQAIDFPIAGKVASPDRVEALFKPSFREQPPNPSLVLSRRLCEEHLATALVASRQALEARQAYFDAGDKFATLALSIAADASAASLLSSEAAAIALRKNISTVESQAESNNLEAIAAHYDEVSSFRSTIEPNAAGPAGDASRSKWLSYISRSVNRGFETMAGFWGSTSQVDAPPGGGQPQFEMSPSRPIVDLESELARRSVVASFRVSHARAGLDQKALDSARVAATGRWATAQAGVEFDEATAELARARAKAASELLKAKRDLTRELSLLDFQGQMELHRRRAQDLLQEATERAAAALDGLRDVYGIWISDLPNASIDSTESLLFWCREVGRLLAGLDPEVVKQTFTFSIRSTGPDWRLKIDQGIRLDASHLQALGRVVRLRDVTVRFIGTDRTSLMVKVATPRQAQDRDVLSNDRGILQDPDEIRLVASTTADLDMASRRTAARTVHNLCPSGIWTLQASGIDSSVEDLLLDLEISYLKG